MVGQWEKEAAGESGHCKNALWHYSAHKSRIFFCVRVVHCLAGNEDSGRIIRAAH